MTTKDDILMDRDKLYPLSKQLETNLSKLLNAINTLFYLYGKPIIISSGYRPGIYNKKANGSKNSAHITCEAVDLSDTNGEIKKFCTPEILIQCGLFMENPISTPTWCHLQIRPTKNRIFKP